MPCKLGMQAATTFASSRPNTCVPCDSKLLALQFLHQEHGSHSDRLANLQKERLVALMLCHVTTLSERERIIIGARFLDENPTALNAFGPARREQPAHEPGRAQGAGQALQAHELGAVNSARPAGQGKRDVKKARNKTPLPC